jgi:hypothetical protein
MEAFDLPGIRKPKVGDIVAIMEEGASEASLFRRISAVPEVPKGCRARVITEPAEGVAKHWKTPREAAV